MARQVQCPGYRQLTCYRRQCHILAQCKPSQVSPFNHNIRVFKRYLFESAAAAVKPDALPPASVEHHFMASCCVEVSGTAAYLMEVPSYVHRSCCQVTVYIIRYYQEIPSNMHLIICVHHVQETVCTIIYLMPFFEVRTGSCYIIVSSDVQLTGVHRQRSVLLVQRSRYFQSTSLKIYIAC